MREPPLEPPLRHAQPLPRALRLPLQRSIPGEAEHRRSHQVPAGRSLYRRGLAFA